MDALAFRNQEAADQLGARLRRTILFDKVSRDWLIRFVEHRIGDRQITRLIAKWLTAGVLEDGRVIETEEGTPQGAVSSPLLANIPPSSMINGSTGGGSDPHTGNGGDCRALRGRLYTLASSIGCESGAIPCRSQGEARPFWTKSSFR